MENKLEQNLNKEEQARPQNPTGEVAAIILDTTVKTLFFLLCTAATLLAFISQCFPSSVINVLNDMGMQKTAAAYAYHAVEQNGNNIKAIIKGTEITSSILDKYIEKSSNNSTPSASILKYSQNLIYFTQKYADSDRFDQQNSKMDKFYHQNASLPSSLISVYKYSDYISCQNIIARTLTSNINYILLDGRLVAIDQVCNNIPSYSLDQMASVLNIIDASVSARYRLNKSTKPNLVVLDSGISNLPNLIIERIESFILSAYDLSISDNITQKIKGFYYLNAALNFQYALELTLPESVFQQFLYLFKIESTTLADYYSTNINQFSYYMV